MNRAEAEQIASAMTMVRPDWLRSSMLTILGRHQHRPARDVHLALVWVAHDPDTRTPARIDTEGPWWAITRTAGVAEATVQPPDRLACPIHGQPEPCPQCPRRATPDQVALRLAEAKASIRASREEGQAITSGEVNRFTSENSDRPTPTTHPDPREAQK